MLNRFISRMKTLKKALQPLRAAPVDSATPAAAPIPPQMGGAIESGQTQELLQLMHPRGIFFKTLALNSKLLDVGAGNGSLAVLKRWPSPPRTDIKLYAYSLSKGESFDEYDGWETGDWEKAKPTFGGMQFDAIFCSQFIEHISSPPEFLQWCTQVLSPTGRLYLEWPSPFSLHAPTREQMRAAGISNIIIGNYKDDKTHNKDLPDRQKIIQSLEQSAFLVEQTGYVHFPFLEEMVALHFSDSDKDRYATTVAYWSKTFWAQYVVASRGAT